MPDHDTLQRFDALPDLLALARERTAARLYEVQDELREQYRADGLAFRWSMPLRCYGKCRYCQEKFSQIIYELEDPRSDTKVSTGEKHIHTVREHDAAMDDKIKLFLAQLNGESESPILP